MGAVFINCNGVDRVRAVVTQGRILTIVGLDISQAQAIEAMGEILNVLSQEDFGKWMEVNCPDIVAEWRAEGVASCAQALDSVDDDGECPACRGTGEGPGESACGHCRGKGFVVEAEHA